MDIDLFKILLPIALIATGIAAGATRYIKAVVFDALPGLLFSICCPCIILTSIGKVDFNELIVGNAYAILFMFVFTIASMLFGFTVAKRTRDEKMKPVVSFSLMFSNATYIGIPVAQLLFGAPGVVFIVVCGMVQDFFVWTVGYRMFTRRSRPSLTGVLVNPIIVSLILALLLSIAGSPEIPVFDDMTAAFGSMTAPLSLLYLGYVLAGDKGAIFRIKGRVLALCAAKVLVIPAIIALILTPLPINGFHKSVSLVIAGLPTPLMSVILSRQFEMDTNLAVEFLLCSTLMYIPASAAVLSVFNF